MSGRIADISIDPKNENTWYVAVGSGGAWKTTNAGTTWTSLTEKMPFYSTGCISVDPNNNESISVCLNTDNNDTAQFDLETSGWSKLISTRPGIDVKNSVINIPPLSGVILKK